MPTFGVAAFLKIASLNPKPQKTELRKRIFGTGGGGYDFHRSLKLANKKFVVGGASMVELLEAATHVTQIPERKSLISGLENLYMWRALNPGVGFNISPKIYKSPKGLFKVSVQPEFGIDAGFGRTAFCVWNNKTPDLNVAAVRATLAMIGDLYDDDEAALTDFGILSLREPKAHLLSESSVSTAAIDWLVGSIESRMLELYDELGSPPPGPPEDRPHP